MWATIVKYVVQNLPAIIITTLVVLAAAVLVNWIYVIPKAKGEGYDKRVAEVAAQDARNDAASKGNLTDLQSKSDYDFCVDRLTRRQLPVSPCEQLLGVSEE